MALKGIAESFYTCKNEIVKRKLYLKPNMTSNGTWLAENTYSCRGSNTLDSVSDIYKVFNTTYTSYVNKFNENTYVEICLPKALPLVGVAISSSDGYLPAKGTIYYSDDGEHYTECSTWEDKAGTSKSASSTWENLGEHKIWRLMSTSRAIKYPTKNADISVISFWYYEEFKVDNTLPEGAGGWVNTYLTHRPHDGLDVRKLEVFYTYKRDDLINLWEGTDSQIKGITESFVTHRPHSGLDVRQLEPYINYRPHDGLDIRQLDVYATVRHEDAIDTYKIPYGIGGYIEAFALYRVLLLAGFLHNFKEIKIKGVAVENHYVPLKSILTINRVEMINNNTEDLETEVDNE